MAHVFNTMIEKLKGYASLQVEKLIIEQKKTEAIIFSIQDGIVMTDYQGKVQLISHRAKSILNIPDDEPILGQALWKFLPSADIKTACMELLTNPENKKSIEVKIPVSEEKTNFYTLTSEQVRTPNKEEALGVVTVLHDITLEKQLDMMKEEFLHSITHDLRNPLTAIRGFIRLFQSGQTGTLSQIQTKMLETMDSASLRLVNMVNDILDLARLESNRLKIHVDEARMEDIISRVVELFQPQARTNGITLKMETEGESLPIQVDANLMERVFTNLVSNATKFTPEGGSITVRYKSMPDSVHCSVNDTGEGIPPSYLEKVFDKFQQVEGHFKGGAGLGLTICKRIVEAHDGKIWVESEVGKGASFMFVIPRRVGQQKEERAA
jgi:signal transduction histidine kinase